MPTIGVFAGAKSSPKMSAMDEVCTCCVATAGHGDVWARVSHPSHSHNTTSLSAVHAATALPSLPAAHATTTRPSSDPQPSSHGSSTALPPPSSSVRCTRWPPWLRSTPGREPHPASSAMLSTAGPVHKLQHQLLTTDQLSGQIWSLACPRLSSAPSLVFAARSRTTTKCNAAVLASLGKRAQL
jgi:hypothetical protein